MLEITCTNEHAHRRGGQMHQLSKAQDIGEPKSDHEKYISITERPFLNLKLSVDPGLDDMVYCNL